MYKLLDQVDKLTDAGRASKALEILCNIETADDGEFLKKEGAKIAELYGAAFSILGDASKAATAYLDAAKRDKFLRAQRGHISSYLFILHYLSGIDTKELYKELANYNNLLQDAEPFPKTKYFHDKIKVGYLLPNPTKSSLTNFIMPLFTKFNGDEFEVYVYTFSEKSDETVDEIRENVTCYKVLDLFSFGDPAKIIRDDEIDILFDLSVHCLGGDTLSILAYRPAPVQIAGIGWPSVTGLPFVDYILADDFLIDDMMKDAPLKLPRAFCFRPDKKMLENFRRAKTDDTTVFGVFNNFMKITDDAILLWKEILNELPNSVLRLHDSTIYSERVTYMENRLENLGISERVDVKTGAQHYFEEISNTDIILDTFPYTGGFMTATAITLGTPVVTLAGERFSSKFSADILKSANLGEFIANDKKEYKSKAIKFATPENPNEFRENLRNRVLNSPLLDEVNYMKNLESAYRSIVN